MRKIKRELCCAFIAAALLIAATGIFAFGITARAAEESASGWANGNGVVLSGIAGRLTESAYNTERFTPSRLSFSVTPEISDGRVTVAFLRDKNKLPDKQSYVRGIYFEFYSEDLTPVLDVVVVERAQTVVKLKGYEIGQTVSVQLSLNSGGAVILKIDGERVIRDFADVTDGVGTSAYSASNVTYAAVLCDEDNAVTVNSVTGDGTVEKYSDEWFYEDSVMPYGGAADLSGSARLTYGFAPQKLNVGFSAYGDVELTLTKSSAFRVSGGAQGLKLAFAEGADSEYYATLSYMHAGEETVLLSGYGTQIAAGEDITVTLRNMLGGGFALELGGNRVYISGKDPLNLFAAEDFSDGTGKTYLAFVSDGEIKVKSIAGSTFDDDPIGKETNEVNSSEIGNGQSDWIGNAAVNGSGVAVISGGSVLNRELFVDYVSFTAEILNLVNSSVADCNISFSVSAGTQETNAELVSSGANSLIFVIKNKNGVCNISVYSRYENTLKTIIGDTALTSVNLYAPVKFELIWSDYELMLTVNGAKFENEYGINPLALYYPKYYRNENQKTYLCFAQSLAAEGTRLTPENSTRYAVYGIDNMLPAEYRDLPQAGQVASAENNGGKLSGGALALTAVIAALVLSGAAVAAWYFLANKKRSPASATDGGAVPENPEEQKEE